MTKLGLVLGVALAAFGSGCAGARSAQASRAEPPPAQPQAQTDAQPSGGGPDTGGRGMHHGAMMQCPMEVPGTQVSVADTPEGEVVTFTTSSPDAVPDLRARIHAMADRYERRHESGQAGMMHDGTSPGGEGGAGSAGSGSPDEQQAPSRAQTPAPSRAVVEDIEGGARIDITPNDPADVEQLRAAIRARVAQMQETGSCAMGQPSSAPQ
jgi:TusA-related sulfurtransferase